MELVGSIGSFSRIGGTGAEMDIYLEPSTLLYRELTVQKEDLATNANDVYSFLPVDRFGKAKLMGITTPRHLLQGRTNCKTWNPKGKAYTTVDRVGSMAIEYNGEQCGDDLASECFEALLAAGTSKLDMTASPEANQLLEMLLQNIYTGLNDSTHDLAWFSRHPEIETANTDGSWDTANWTTQEWADFYGQQFATDDDGNQIKGWLTLIDEEKAAGTPHLDTEFVDGDFDDTTGAYTGSDIEAEFVKAINQVHPHFLPVVRRRRGNVGASFLVSLSVFDAYKRALIADHGAITEGYQLKVNGEVVPGVLMYDGLPVIAMDEWEYMDRMLGIRSHRILLTANGNLGLSHGVTPLPQGQNVGLRLQRSPVLKDKGRIDMYATFRLGAFIADTNMMSMISLTETPA